MTRARATRGRILRAEDVARLRAAERVLRDAERKRETALIEAEETARRMSLEAHQRALAEGAGATARMLADAEARAERQLKALESDLARIVLQTVGEIIGQADRDEAVRLATAQALQRLRDHRRARIAAAPDVAEAVRAAVASLGGDGAAEVLDVRVDERLGPGRTILSSDRGHVEIGLEHQVSLATEVWRRAADAEASER